MARQLDVFTPQELFLLRLALEGVKASTERLLQLVEDLDTGLTFQEGLPDARPDQYHADSCIELPF